MSTLTRILVNACLALLLVVGSGWLMLELTGGWYEYRAAGSSTEVREMATNANREGWEPVPGTKGGDGFFTYHYRRPRIRIGR